MGLFDFSKTSSTSTPSSATVAPESELAPYSALINVAQTGATKSGVDVVLNQSGIDGQTLLGVLDRYGTGLTGAFTTAQTANTAVSDIAKAATATQTETGMLIQRLAVPIIVVVGILFFALVYFLRRSR